MEQVVDRPAGTPSSSGRFDWLRWTTGVFLLFGAFGAASAVSAAVGLSAVLLGVRGQPLVWATYVATAAGFLVAVVGFFGWYASRVRRGRKGLTWKSHLGLALTLPAGG